MSVKAMAAVWDLKMSPSEKLVLLAFADHADHEGGNIYPGLDTIAEKTGYSRRQVIRITQELVSGKFLTVSARGIGRGRPVHYRLGKSVKMSPFKLRGAERRVTFETKKGDIAMSPDPSLTIKELKDSSSATQAPPRTPLILAMEQLERTFAEARNVPVPDWKKQPAATNKLWRIPLKRIYHLCDDDLPTSETVIRRVVSRMLEERLTFSMPAQILKTAESFIADRKPRQERSG